MKILYNRKLRFIGRGLLTEADKPRWKHRRNIFNPAFHKQYDTKISLLKGFHE